MPGRKRMKVLESATSNSGYRTLAYLAAIIILAYTACATPARPAPASGSGVTSKDTEKPEETPRYSEQEMLEIEAAKDTVKRYWISTNSSYVGMYDLFSTSYKKVLSDFDGIKNEEAFRESIPPTERIWPKQTYHSAEFTASRDEQQIQVVVLSQWQEKGYTGVMTFIFDLVKEGEEWKIANIMF